MNTGSAGREDAACAVFDWPSLLEPDLFENVGGKDQRGAGGEGWNQQRGLPLKEGFSAVMADDDPRDEPEERHDLRRKPS